MPKLDKGTIEVDDAALAQKLAQPVSAQELAQSAAPPKFTAVSHPALYASYTRKMQAKKREGMALVDQFKSGAIGKSQGFQLFMKARAWRNNWINWCHLRRICHGAWKSDFQNGHFQCLDFIVVCCQFSELCQKPLGILFPV